jgi:riboflavin transporter FmnP
MRRQTSFILSPADSTLDLAMKTKSIALVIMFAAVAIGLTVIKIPTVFYPGGFFRFSQIPVVIAFLLFGFRIGGLVGFVTLIGQIALFPFNASAVFIAYPMEFASSLVMFAGMHFSNRLIKNDGSGRYSRLKKPAIGLTAFAALFRGSIMPFADYGVTFHVLVPLVLQIKVPEAYIVGLVPSFIAYNVIVPLYTVPAAYVVAKRVNLSLDL